MLWLSCDYIVLQYKMITTCSLSLFLSVSSRGDTLGACRTRGGRHAHDVVHGDGTLSMLKMSRIHNSKSVRGRWLLFTSCVSSDKSAMAS